MIQTVLGPIKEEDLGVCLPHEHIWCDQNYGPRFDVMGSTRNPSGFMKPGQLRSRRVRASRLQRCRRRSPGGGHL